MVERGLNTPENTGESFEAQPTEGEDVERPIVEHSSEPIENVPEVNTLTPTDNKVDTNRDVVLPDIKLIANGSITLDPSKLEEAMETVFSSGTETIEDQTSSDVEDVAA